MIQLQDGLQVESDIRNVTNQTNGQLLDYFNNIYPNIHIPGLSKFLKKNYVFWQSLQVEVASWCPYVFFAVLYLLSPQADSQSVIVARYDLTAQQGARQDDSPVQGSTLQSNRELKVKNHWLVIKLGIGDF